MLGLVGIVLAASAGAVEAPERWSRVEVPGLAEPDILAMGEVRFPDGRAGQWVGTTVGTWRRIDDGWEPWPVIAGRSPGVRAVLVAPDETGLTAWWLATADGLLISRDGESWQQQTSAGTALVDDNLRALHLHQTRNTTPEIWIGTDQGLTIWRGGQWEIVAARSDGFHGGQVHSIRPLIINGQRQLWVAGTAGVSRHVDGQWRRWGAACLRGRRIQAIESVEYPDGLRLAVGTDRGLILLDPVASENCGSLSYGDDQVGNIQHLARDRHDQLYLFSPTRIDRVIMRPGRDGVSTQWTFFDQRDGLAKDLNRMQASMTLSDGRLLVGSDQGLWQLHPINAREHRAANLQVSLATATRQQRAGDRGRINVDGENATLTIQASGSDRPHALRYRYGIADLAGKAWHATGQVQLQDPAYGLQTLLVEIADEFGHVHGPLRFTLDYPRPWALYLGVAGVLVLVGGLMTVLIRRRR